MLLTIDIGNTNITLGLYEGETLSGHWRMATNHESMPDEYGIMMSNLLEHRGINTRDLEGICMASVVPPLTSRVIQACNNYLESEPLNVDYMTKTGVKIMIDQPQTVGADRIVDVVATKRLYGGPACVVDFGTATTFDVADTDGAYIGGVISPGVNLSLEALHMAAAALPHVDVAKPAKAIGTNTVACMQSGVYWGYIGLVEGIVREVRRERDRPMKVIATGGLASLFAQGTELFHSIEDDLTMHGLVLINACNKDAP